MSNKTPLPESTPETIRTYAPLPFGYQLLSGAIAGVSELLVMYPLDVVKTRMQLQTSKSIVQYNGLFDCIKKIVAKEGTSQLYKGITSPILMEAPKRATKFAFNEKFIKFYSDNFFEGQLNQRVSIMSGASAGVAEACVIVPFELVKVRLQDTVSNKNLKGPLDAVKAIILKDGILGLYNGLESTIWRHGSWNAGYFGIIYQIRSLLPKATNKIDKVKNDLLAGTVGGTMGCVLSTPFDVVKSRIQSVSNEVVDLKDSTKFIKKYNWSLPAIKTIFQEEGFAALYKGFIPKIARLGPGGGILLIVFGSMTEFFQKMRDV